jgi:hypothetical protein
MTLQQPMFPPPRHAAENDAHALKAKTTHPRSGTSNKRPSNAAKRKKPKQDRIPGLCYPTGVTPDEFFESLGKLKKEAELEVERLLSFLDHADGYTCDEREPDDEADGDSGGIVDDEPSLGAANMLNQHRAWSIRENRSAAAFAAVDCEDDELDTGECSDLDHYGEADGLDGGNVDDEPWLGALEVGSHNQNFNQARSWREWGDEGGDEDYGEHDEAEYAQVI